MSTMYVFDESGLNALINHIKTTRTMADSNESAIGGLGEDLVGLTEAVEADLAGKQDALTFDTEPTEGSTNPVTSGGVATAIKSVGGTPIVAATSTDGVTYTATVDGMDSLVVGKEIMIVPDCNSTVINPKLNVNGLGDKYLRCPTGANNTTTTTAASASWLYAGKPVSVRWNGTFWVTDIFRMDSSILYNAVPIEKGGTGATTAAAALEALGALSKTQDTANAGKYLMVGDDGSIIFGSPMAAGSQEVYTNTVYLQGNDESVTFTQVVQRVVLEVHTSSSYDTDTHTYQLDRGGNVNQYIPLQYSSNGSSSLEFTATLSSDGKTLSFTSGYWYSSSFRLIFLVRGYA